MRRKPTRTLILALAALAPAAAARGQAVWPADFRVAEPTIPDHTFKLSDYGAVGDGRTMNTAALGKAIAAVTAAGGGHLVVPAGTFLTGPFALASNLDLHLDAGATVLFSDDRHDFKKIENGYENCIVGDDLHDLSITGQGTIDGHGRSWWDEYMPFKRGQTKVEPPHRPYLIRLLRPTRLLVRGVTLTNSPMLTLFPVLAHDATIDSVRIISPANSPNTDGIDIGGTNVHIVNCTIDTGDDDVVLKPRTVKDPDHLSCENILVEKCTIKHGHGVSIGGGSVGGVRNFLVQDCTFTDTDFGVRLKSGRGNGGPVEHLTYRNLTMERVKTSVLITSYYPSIPEDPAADPAKPMTKRTPVWRDILIENVTSTDSPNPLRIVGLAEAPVENVTFKDDHLSGTREVEIVHARGVKLVDTTVTTTSGKPPELFDAGVTDTAGKITATPGNR